MKEVVHMQRPTYSDHEHVTIPPEHRHDRSLSQELQASQGHESHNISAASISSTTARPKLTKRARTNTIQNVFQAREEVEKRDKHNYFKKTRKDKLLSRHFGDRDIVSSFDRPRAEAHVKRY